MKRFNKRLSSASVLSFADSARKCIKVSSQLTSPEETLAVIAEVLGVSRPPRLLVSLLEEPAHDTRAKSRRCDGEHERWLHRVKAGLKEVATIPGCWIFSEAGCSRAAEKSWMRTTKKWASLIGFTSLKLFPTAEGFSKEAIVAQTGPACSRCSPKETGCWRGYDCIVQTESVTSDQPLDNHTVRHEIERHIRHQKAIYSDGLRLSCTPAVLVIVTETKDAIEAARRSLETDPPTPVVVYTQSGTGGIFALAHAFTSKDGHFSNTARFASQRQLMETLDCDEAECEKLMNSVEFCMRQRNLIFVVNESSSYPTKTETFADVLLTALLESCSTFSQEKWLHIARAWGRRDLAHKLLSWSRDKLTADVFSSVFVEALLNDQAEVVKHIMRDYPEFSDFLTVTRIEDLYWQSNGRRQYKYLPEIINSTNEFLEGDYSRLYDTVAGEEKRKDANDNLMGHCSQFLHPFSVLMIWAAVANKLKVARLMYLQSPSGTIIKAIILSRLCKVMAIVDNNYINHKDLHAVRKYGRAAKKFEKEAIQSLSEYYAEHGDRVRWLLTSKTEWNDLTLLELAHHYRMHELLRNRICLHVLHDIWMGGLVINRPVALKVIGGILFPPAVTEAWCIKASSWKHLEDHFQHAASQKERTIANTKINRWWLNYTTFHSAPVTKFLVHKAMHLMLVLCLSYAALFTAADSLHGVEAFCITYVILHTLEMTKEAIGKPHYGLEIKIRAFARDKWNLVSILGNCLILFGILMHLSGLESGLSWAKALYGVATTLCTLQALEFLNASSSTAEFTALIVKTVIVIGKFCLIATVFVFAFGIPHHAILKPQTEASWDTLKNVTLIPYFMVYGELFEEQLRVDCKGSTDAECWPGLWLRPLLQCIYLLLAVACLINVFFTWINSEYSALREDCNKKWAYNYCSLVLKYQAAPALPPPLSALYYFRCLTHFVLRIQNDASLLHMCEDRQSTATVQATTVTTTELGERKNMPDDSLEVEDMWQPGAALHYEDSDSYLSSMEIRNLELETQRAIVETQRLRERMASLELLAKENLILTSHLYDICRRSGMSLSQS